MSAQFPAFRFHAKAPEISCFALDLPGKGFFSVLWIEIPGSDFLQPQRLGNLSCNKNLQTAGQLIGNRIQAFYPKGISAAGKGNLLSRLKGRLFSSFIYVCVSQSGFQFS